MTVEPQLARVIKHLPFEVTHAVWSTSPPSPMRSRQVNFFLTPKDQADLLCRLDPDNRFAHVAWRCQDGRMQILPTAAIRQMGQEPLSIYIARADDLDAIVFNEGENYKNVDVIRSPVVEFTRC